MGGLKGIIPRAPIIWCKECREHGQRTAHKESSTVGSFVVVPVRRKNETQWISFDFVIP